MPISKHHKKNISASQWKKRSNREKHKTMLWNKEQKEIEEAKKGNNNEI